MISPGNAELKSLGDKRSSRVVPVHERVLWVEFFVFFGIGVCLKGGGGHMEEFSFFLLLVFPSSPAILSLRASNPRSLHRL